jgi:hypothetical protein
MAVIKQKIYVGNLANVMSLFDQIQVHRSEDGEDDTYSEITAAAAAGATILGTEEGPFTLNGTTIRLVVDSGAEQEVTFVSADPIETSDVASFLTSELSGVTASDDGGAIRLTSATTGTGSKLLVTGGTSLAELGFVLDDEDTGEDVRITLVAGQSEYEYDDQDGDVDYFYKTRYYNSATLAVSSFSIAVQGSVGSIIGASHLIKGTLDLATLDGVPVVGRRVTFHPIYVASGLVDDGIGVVRGDIQIYTDTSGHAEVMLVRGALVDVTISGTGITRRITIPSTGTEFDVLGEVAAADDIFQIQVPDIPAAVRRS